MNSQEPFECETESDKLAQLYMKLNATSQQDAHTVSQTLSEYELSLLDKTEGERDLEKLDQTKLRPSFVS